MKKINKFIPQMEPWYGKEEIKAETDYLKSGGWIMEYKKTRELEQMIADYVGVKYCSILPNGTLTLWAALAVLGIGRGDEVIVPDYTMVATPNAVVLSGAKPVFVDIERETLCLDFELTSKAITRKTKAIILVTINGRYPKMKNFRRIAKEKNIYLIEDAAQSFGSKYKDRHLGTWGIMGSYSFSMPKIITFGQGGALVTDNKRLYQRLLQFRDFGRPSGGSDDYQILGFNLKFSDLQAVFGIEQMKKMQWRVKRKKVIYQLYSLKLKDIKEVKFIQTNLKNTAPWFIDILVPDPDALSRYLKENNIGSRRFYPTLHNLPFYKIAGEFNNSIYASKHGLWLPSSSKLRDQEIAYICERINNFYAL